MTQRLAPQSAQEREAVREIPGFEGRYGATEDGRIWSYPKRYAANKSQGHNGKWMSIHPTTGGYRMVFLTTLEGKHVAKLVHRLVADAFLPNPRGLPQINHKNCDKTDNCTTNLEWCTGTENVQHSLANGLRNGKTAAQISASRRNQKIAAAASQRKAQARKDARSQP